MPAYRVTMIIGDRNMGASETWITPQQTSASTARNAINNLITARNKCLPNNIYWVGVRISQWSDPATPGVGLRRSQLMLPGSQVWKTGGDSITVPAQGTIDPTVGDGSFYPDQFRSCVQHRVTFDTDRNATRYMVGLPRAGFDGVSEGYNLAAIPRSLRTNLVAYYQLLIASWQLQALDRTAANLPVVPVGISAGPQTPPLTGISFNGARPASFSMGARIQLQGFRPKKGTRSPTLNGTWYISSVTDGTPVGGWTLYLRSSEAVIPGDQRFTDRTKVYLYKNTLYGISLIQPVRAGIHERGRPTGSPRGRRLSRPTLDP